MSADLKVKRELAERLAIEISVVCDNCGQCEISDFSSAFDAVNEFFRNGWRVSGGYPLCRECAEAK